MPGERGAAGIAGPKGDRVSDSDMGGHRVSSVPPGLSWAHTDPVLPRRETSERRDLRERLERTELE